MWIFGEIVSMASFCQTCQVESAHFILEMHNSYFLIAGATEGNEHGDTTLLKYTNTSFSQSRLKCREMFACNVWKEKLTHCKLVFHMIFLLLGWVFFYLVEGNISGWIMLLIVNRIFLSCFWSAVCAVLVGLENPLPQNTVFTSWESWM